MVLALLSSYKVTLFDQRRTVDQQVQVNTVTLVIHSH